MGGLFSTPDIVMPKTEPVVAPAPSSEEATVVKASDTQTQLDKKLLQQAQGTKSLAIPIGMM